MKSPTIYPAADAASPACRCGCGRSVYNETSGRPRLYFSDTCKRRHYERMSCKAPTREDAQIEDKRQQRPDPPPILTGPKPKHCALCPACTRGWTCAHPFLDFSRWGGARAAEIKARGFCPWGRQ